LPSKAASEETGKNKGGPRFLAGFTAVLVVAVAVLAFFSHKGFFQSYRVRQERLHLEQENVRLAEENARLARTIDRLQNDPEMIQDLIRRELNFIKKNETIIQFAPPAGPQAADVGKEQPPVNAPGEVKGPDGRKKAAVKHSAAPPRKKTVAKASSAPASEE